MVHRPAAELARITPRNSGFLLFDDIPWVGRAQEEHDAFTEAMRAHDVEVLYVDALLAEVLALEPARAELTEAVLADVRLGDALRRRVGDYLNYLDPEGLATVLVAGLAHEELRSVLTPAPDPPLAGGLVYALMDRHDFVAPPLPNLLFTRDSSVWLARPRRGDEPRDAGPRRESTLTNHLSAPPRFAGHAAGLPAPPEHLRVGTCYCSPRGDRSRRGERTAPAGVERLAAGSSPPGWPGHAGGPDRPAAGDDAPGHDRHDGRHRSVLMYANGRRPLVACRLTAGPEPDSDPRLHPPAPFLTVAAEAMGVDRINVIDTGLDPVTAEREQWDDGNNTLAIAPRPVVAYERNVETNARLERAGIEVIRVPGSELGSGRGGPRCMSCPLVRDPLPGFDPQQGSPTGP